MAEDTCNTCLPVQSPCERTGSISPICNHKEEEKEESLLPILYREKSSDIHFFSEPFLPKKEKEDKILDGQKAQSPPASISPIRSQPVALPEAVTPISPVKPPSTVPLESISPPLAPLPICSQPLPTTEASVTPPAEPPVCFQPIPAFTSTPLAKLALKSQDGQMEKLESPNTTEEILKRNNLVEEFWMKSAEIRRSLGLTPVNRSRGSDPNFTYSPLECAPLKLYNSDVGPEEKGIHPVKPPKVIMPKLDKEQFSLLTPTSQSEKELKNSKDVKRDLSSSSGLGLQGSSSNMRTLASQSFNTSDSTMLTPPSSPPPPPPQNEEPATLRRKRHQAIWQKESEPIQTPQVAPANERIRPTRSSSQPPREEVRKSFVESVDEIPFADDVEDTYDDRTEDTSLNEKYYTPPSKPRPEKPLQLHGVKGNDRSSSSEGGKRGLPQVSAEAKELAEERMRAREKSIKSQALRDAMAKQLSRMKDLEMTSSALAAKSHKASTAPSKTKEFALDPSKHPTGKTSQGPTLKHHASSERFFPPLTDISGHDGSITSSEGSGGKNKKRSSLFSPRKNKKEKKSKNENKQSDKSSSAAEESTKPKSLWKSVFSGYKKDKKKKADDKSCPSTPSSGATVDSGKHKASPLVRAADLQLRQHLSFSEDSDLSNEDVLERSSQRSKREHKAYTEEELNAKLTRRVQKAARRQAKQEELKRLHRAQIIQRQLEQVEEKQRQLEERGVAVEKALRGEAGMGKKDDPKLMQEWFKLVQEKNALVRYESELMIFARELELEDRQSRLQQELRERMAVEDQLKTDEELSEEKKILNEMLEVVEQRDSLVALLEEQRLREKEEDKDLEAVMLSKGFNLNWS
ncbi:PREDICTED: protein-methionine sulfoxide oxidase MICAL3-like isoform X2 [Thamnophis sirtalis]|uniref:Protein-methionine sulfoxide oxidase MICAL3-like isoform X2 n=1 Tax=Thamnophis sirtalis TaxID=35019 RepID=A0A6I9YYK6_9SAUR|nr:PREDICTED: protein-methionine sulfoxide oxidase MICAL3-like isoform X2 [Thamnophis sirtalis]